jgi:hypothetical protein
MFPGMESASCIWKISCQCCNGFRARFQQFGSCHSLLVARLMACSRGRALPTAEVSAERDLSQSLPIHCMYASTVLETMPTKSFHKKDQNLDPVLVVEQRISLTLHLLYNLHRVALKSHVWRDAPCRLHYQSDGLALQCPMSNVQCPMSPW